MSPAPPAADKTPRTRPTRPAQGLPRAAHPILTAETPEPLHEASAPTRVCSYDLQLAFFQPSGVDRRYFVWLVVDDVRTGLFHNVILESEHWDKQRFDDPTAYGKDELSAEQFIALRERCRRLRVQYQDRHNVILERAYP